MAGFSHDDPEAAKKMRGMFGPGQIDSSIRQTIQLCWMMLPDDGKSVDRLEQEFRRIVDRALKDLREDAKAFGISE